MTDQWRALLYYVGFLSSLAFGARFLVQWIGSERQKRSVVTPLFWKLSLLGNITLLSHSFIQMQLHVFLVQTGNAVISWRNLNLMQPPTKQASFRTTLRILIGAILLGTCLYLLQYAFLGEPGPLFRIPITPWNTSQDSETSPLWHVLGFTGLILFNSRFWVQWWGAELQHQSYLGPAFWWLSLIGDTLCLAYFARLGDPVNLVGPLFGLIPYIRNLMLLKKTKQTALSQP